MEKWKKLLTKLFCPPLWVLIVLIMLSLAAFIFPLIKWQPVWLVETILLFIFVYTLFVIGFNGFIFLENYKENIQKAVQRYIKDAAFRTHISLYISLAINLLYATMNLFSGLTSHSNWFWILACYYSILAIMRFLLVSYVNRVGIGNEYKEELKRSRLCAYILLVMNLPLTSAIFMMLNQNKGNDYPGALIYVMGLYTFYVTIHSIASLIRFQKYKSPVMSVSKVINFAAALVSMLSLETALLAKFAKEILEYRRHVIALTGTGVALTITLMSLVIIIQTSKVIKNEP